ncbi:MAG: hypothetical protein RR977_01905, partial [Oscillospiraceae bacterium]
VENNYFSVPGAAILVEEKNYDREKLLRRVEDLYRNPEKLQSFSENASRLAVLDTAERIYNIIMEKLGEK